jgi:hypothetical protein
MPVRLTIGDRSPIPAHRRLTTPQGAPREPGLFLPRRTLQASLAMTSSRHCVGGNDLAKEIDGETYL